MGVVNKPSNEGTYTINPLKRHMRQLYESIERWIQFIIYGDTKEQQIP